MTTEQEDGRGEDAPRPIVRPKSFYQREADAHEAGDCYDDCGPCRAEANGCTCYDQDRGGRMNCPFHGAPT